MTTKKKILRQKDDEKDNDRSLESWAKIILPKNYKGEKEKLEKTSKKLENYPIDCDDCDCKKKLKGYWVSGVGMTISLYQCPECKDITLMQSDEPLFVRGICPRCGSENINVLDTESECTDCGLFFRERFVDEKFSS